MKKLIAILVVAITATVMLPLAVYADPALPDAIDIPKIYVNTWVIEEDDVLIIAEYNLQYDPTPVPADPADVNFIFRLIDTDGVTEIGQALPYPYFNTGYGYGVVSFYFSAADALDWGENYIIRIYGNPSKFATPPVEPFVIASGDYTALTDHEGNQAQLADRIREIAGDLEVEWNATLLGESDIGGDDVLTGAGQGYFAHVIQGLQVMSPSLFLVQKLSVDTSKRVWGTSKSDTYKNFLNGTDIKAGIDAVADAINIPSILLMGIPILIGCVFFIWKSQQKWQTASPGYLASFLLVTCGGMLFYGLTLVALVAFACVLLTGYFIFFKKA